VGATTKILLEINVENMGIAGNMNPRSLIGLGATCTRDATTEKGENTKIMEVEA
jgi:hypothetical protein